MALTSFEQHVLDAMPFSLQALDFERAAQDITHYTHESGDHALYLSTRKNLYEPNRFPLSLIVDCYSVKDQQAQRLFEFDLTRPDYKPNDLGVAGNHVVIGIINHLRQACLLLEPKLQIFTSQTTWIRYCNDPSSWAVTEQILMENTIPAFESAPASGRGKTFRI